MPEPDKRAHVVVTACMRGDGKPTFARSEVAVTAEEAENGVQYDLVETDLQAAGFEEPFVHFSAEDSPVFLFAAVDEFLGVTPTPVILEKSGDIMNRVIEVTVSPKGDTVIQTKGFLGGDCLEASKYLEQALGVVANEHKTGEFYQVAESEQNVVQK